MARKQEKSSKVHSVRVSKELDEWVEKKIKSHEFGSWTHAIEWGLALLKEKFQSENK